MVHRRCKLVWAKGLCGLQRGFVHGRQLISNIVDFVAYAHAYSMQVAPGRLPLMVFWDFAAALPSIAHTWRFCGAPCNELPCWFTHVHTKHIP